ncbi:rhodanese-like domain-containing protein [Rhizobacter sp. LjRoot28]|uniref:rhodanese-like domain-containing protein n=1 Tax=Rhizobacter sp. LjRoot28 TaxID=3342309 RepID=UPI003ECC4053
MNFLAETWYLFAIALVSGGLLLWPTIRRGAPAGGVSTAEAVLLINREKAVLIDVRDPAEYAAGHVMNAKNIPLATLESSTLLPKNKALPLVVVCNRGAQASRAVVMLKKLGYENARTLTGGLMAWREANLPVEKSA